MSDQFETWEKLLALAETNKTKATMRAAIHAASIFISESEPWSGYYRCAAVKDGPLLPVAIWREGATLHVMRANEPVALARVWPYCVWSPIPYDWYEGATERGEKWPDAAVSVAEQPAEQTTVTAASPADVGALTISTGIGTGITLAEDAAVKAKREIETAKSVAEKFYAVVTSDEEAGAAQEARARLNTMASTADKKRKAEKQPYLDGSKAVDEKWMPIVKLAKDAADTIRTALSGWENVKFAVEKEEAAKKIPAADRTVERQDNEPPHVEAAPVATMIRGASGRAARVEVVNVVTIVDQDALYRHCKAIPEIAAALHKVAQRLVDAGHQVPGVTVNTQRDVA